MSNSDKIIANSIASANFCKKLKNKECLVVYRGVEVEKIEEIEPNQEIGKKYENNVIVTFVGRLIDGKGVHDLLEVLGRLNKKGVLCFVIGSGPQKKKLLELAKKFRISDKVIFFGHKNFHETMGILKVSDIFVNPSYTEGLPTSVIEAALCKKAIVATNVGGTPEIIHNNESGYLIEEKNVKMLKEKLELLIDNEEKRKTLGERAYLEVSQKFTWQNSTEKYLQIFNDLLATKK